MMSNISRYMGRIIFLITVVFIFCGAIVYSESALAKKHILEEEKTLQVLFEEAMKKWILQRF